VLNNLSVNLRLFTLVAFLSLLSILVGASGLIGMSSTLEGFQRVYDSRVVPLRDLKVIADMYAVNIVDTTHKLHNGNIGWEEGRKNLQDAESTIAQKWKGYKASSLNAEEQKRVAEIDTMLIAVQVEIDKLRGIMSRESDKGIARFAEGPLYPAIDPISTKFSDLIELQLNLAKQEYETSRETYAQLRVISLTLLAAGILAGIVLAYWIVSSVVNPLKKVQEVLANVAKSFDYSQRVRVDQKDEVGQTARAINQLLEAQQGAVQQVNEVVTHLASGNLDRRIESNLRGDLLIMKDAINQSMQSVQTTMTSFNALSRALAQGNFAYKIHYDTIQGEYRKTLSQAMDSMQAMESMIGNVGNVMGSVAQGDLSQRVTSQGFGDLDRLKHNINVSLSELSQSMRAVHDNTRQVATAANETSNAIGQISDGAQNQTHAISQVATAVRQTAESVADVSRNTAVASQKSKESMDTMRKGMDKMAQMVEVVSSIAANSEKINKITEVIENIANKTNLLSLNAAIEAARAGEHGKGFSVVAEEVGKLAANSAESSQEIARLVQQAVAETNRAVATVKEVSSDMGLIERGSQETDQMLQRISAALEEQSSALDEIRTNVAGLDRIAQSNAAASEEITATVIELSKLADVTRKEVEKFSL
jgi:methyl-accepting chemotaxis protein